MVKVGDKTRILIAVLEDPSGKNGKLTMRSGTVVFVHPKGRFHTVAVPFGRGDLRYTIEGVD